MGMVAWLACIQLLQAVAWLCCAHAEAGTMSVSRCLCCVVRLVFHQCACHEMTHALGRVAPSVLVLTAAGVSRHGFAASSSGLGDLADYALLPVQACARLPPASLI